MIIIREGSYEYDIGYNVGNYSGSCVGAGPTPCYEAPR